MHHEDSVSTQRVMCYIHSVLKLVDQCVGVVIMYRHITNQFLLLRLRDTMH